MPKCVYDMNQKTEELHDFATGLLPDSNDAQKTMAKLEQKQINRFYIGTLAHIPCVSLFCSPWTVARFHTIPEQGENWTQNSLFQSSTAYLVLTLFLTLTFLRPTENSQSMSNTKLKWLFGIPTICWAKMAICPMRYVAAMLYS
jgi:hypothetical protein